MRQRSYLQARRAATQDSTRPTDRLALASVLVGALVVMLALVVHGILWVGPPPNMMQVIDPNNGQTPPHVQSGFVPPDGDSGSS